MSKKTPEQIINSIFSILSDDKFSSIFEIGKAINSHSRTVKRYIKLISDVQNMPKLELAEKSSGFLVKIKKNDDNEKQNEMSKI